MDRAKSREEVAQRVRDLLDTCVGSELGGYDSLRATLEVEIAKKQVANMAEDEAAGLYSTGYGKEWLARSRPAAVERVRATEGRLADLEAETARRMAEWEAQGK
ncbi:hypothetical protein ACIPLC_30915 [Kitasatospora sp. NPDC086801]|uniref:hypothetical protein n=1 Tax=Kitasatospora sp. NPDC086801 TaxID=3364066 RepID=UPI003821FCB0